jgi:glycosyltransferase involved in cell wall biosynthesis
MLIAKHGKANSQRRSLRAESDPFVTIAIPTFNRASWLKDCILSALSQTYPHFEIVVSDNASTDDTQKVLRQFRSRRLRVIRQKKNIGLLPNWNACLAEARGEYILLVSDDDKVSPWLLERSVALVRRDRQIPIVIALSDIFFPEVARVWKPFSKLKTGVWNGADILQELLKLPMLAGMSTYMIQTEALRARGGFPLDFPHSADMAVWAPLLFTEKAGFVNEICGTLRLHNARQTSRFTIDARLNDGEKLTGHLIEIADQSIKDPKKRERIKRLFARFFARSVFLNLAQYRREGAKLNEVLPLLWQWRAKTKNVGASHIFALVSTLAVILLPARIVAWSRRFRRTYRHKFDWSSPKRLRFASMRYLD